MEALRDALRGIAAQEMAQDSAHDLAHLDRVWASCNRIASAEGGDLRVLLAGAYLHDLVNLPKDALNRAEASTLAAAPTPRGLGLPLRAGSLRPGSLRPGSAKATRRHIRAGVLLPTGR